MNFRIYYLRIFCRSNPSIRKNEKYDNFIFWKKIVYLKITSNVIVNNGIIEVLKKFGKIGENENKKLELKFKKT